MESETIHFLFFFFQYIIEMDNIKERRDRMKNILEIGKKLGISENDMILYGNTKAKVKTPINPNPHSKLIVVTAINPTPYGEGKTTISIGLNDAFCQRGKKSVVVLREPSLGPVFGMKGGATGGGKASVIPSDEINLHFTGDFHAITSANNLLAAAIDNHIYQGNELKIDEKTVCFQRCLDVNDRSLRNQFQITAASETMAIFCLATSFSDLTRRLGNILCAYNQDGQPIHAKDLKVEKAMALLLKDAFHPNLVQTMEENPALIHGGPFANIAHGCNSIVATKLGLTLADYVVTEAGFGSDLGLEKFMNIKCRKANLTPNFIVLVVTKRALEHSGIENLNAHIDHLKQYQVPFCVAINKFSEEKEEYYNEIKKKCLEEQVACIVTNSYQEGGIGSLELADYIINIGLNQENHFHYLYEDNSNISQKIEILAKKVYHAEKVEYSKEALEKLEKIKELNLNHYPVCIAKTQYSISDNRELLGYPKGHTIHVKDIIIETGSEMIVVLLNKIITMPGLPSHPNFETME